ncbi:MAG: hypothetical protein WAM60_20545 [Candidatus Promineifilaceae bacterium]
MTQQLFELAAKDNSEGVKEPARPSTIRWRYYGREYGLPLLLFGLFTLIITWPTIRDFNTLIVSDGGDARNNLWMLWHVKEALLGHQPWFELNLLYYPLGVNLLTRGLGPLVGIFALPFWPFGPEAAYNGTMIITVWLTGWTMYLLARDLNFNRPIAYFAGLFLLTAPMHLIGINGHMTKSFMALLPLVFMAFLRLLDLKRSRWWAVATAVILLLTLLHNGYQFVFAGLAIAFFGIAAFLRADTAEKRPIIQRGILLAIATIIIVGPLLLAITRASADPLVPVNANPQSTTFQPDLAEFILPPANSRLFGLWVQNILNSHGHKPIIETAVSLSWVGILLCMVAAYYVRKESLTWWLFALISTILAIGPSLKILGDRLFTEYSLPVIMPYALLTALPGFDFMRAPGRFMMIGFVAMGIAAAYGLKWLVGRFPRFGSYIILTASLLLLVERWPTAWNQQPLRPVPDFYQELAADPEEYGVFDLPLKAEEDDSHITYAAAYQMDQMVHHKGIASGYLARTYRIHPMFPCLIPETRAPEPDITVNGRPSDCAANFLFDLAYFNYRYVVLHKPVPDDLYDAPDSWGQAQSAELLARFFPNQAPIVDDDLVTVYEVSPFAENANLQPQIGFGANWYPAEAKIRWAKSPAVLFLSLPQSQQVNLELQPALVYEPDADGNWLQGRLQVAVDNSYTTTVDLHNGEKTTIPLDLEAGTYSITLTLEAGNFRPLDYGQDDLRYLSFALSSVNLTTNPSP